MKHLGDITKINGAEAEPVEVIIGGSPCQDLSVAGKRAGLDGERSGLFMEQIRIIKEMRENDRRAGRTDEYVRPRFMVWENVPGAFSSNRGEDFRIVLEETARIAEPEVSIPRPPAGKWTNAGCIMGNGYSIAWRIIDAQYFGVPQRRRRIALVADFGGETAPEILFERDSMQGDFTESREKGQRAAADAQSGIDTAISFQERAGCAGGVKASSSNTTEQGHSPRSTIKECYGISAFESNSMKSCNPNSGIYKADTSRTLDNNGGNPACNQGGMIIVESTGGKIADTLDASYYKGPGKRGDKERTVVCVLCDRKSPSGQQGEIERSDGPGADEQNGHGGGNVPMLYDTDNLIVRRLTPLECERLQGYPDHWTDIGEWTDSKGKKHKAADSPRYKALGNSIAVPCWRFILRNINEHCTEHTMASLFDGIAGFCLIWYELGGKIRFVSEIEEYPIAVCKKHFGDEDIGEDGDIENYIRKKVIK